MKTISLVFALLLATAAFAFPNRYAYWFHGPARHLMTADEMTRWAAVQTDVEAKAFIDLFWAKRDPTPGTPRNEFQDEFDVRVSLADQFFSTVRTMGSMSDRGRALILLGAPYQVGSSGEAVSAPANPNFTSVGQWDGVVRGPRAEPAMINWAYSHGKKPAFIQRKDFEILFVDERGGGEYEFAKTSRINPEIVLQEAVNAYIVSPDLTEAPQFAEQGPVRVTSFTTPALMDAYRRFRSEKTKSVGAAHLTWGQFVTPAGELFTPVSLYIPAGAGIAPGRKLTFFGVVENGDGEILEVYEDPVTVSASGRDSYVDKSLKLAPGRYHATFGLAEEGRVLTMTKTEMTITSLDPTESSISQLILSNNAFALPEAQQLTDPFAFGGLKVVPKGDATFSVKDEIWYFVEMRNPGLAPAGVPRVQLMIDVRGKTDQQKTVRLALPLQQIDTLPLKGVDNHYALFVASPLKDFAPGQYTVKVRVVDMVLQKSYDLEKQFHVN